MTFGSCGYGPQARSVLHCHGVLALRGGPWPGAVQDESWQAKSRLGASFYSVQKVTFGAQSQGLELEKARFEASF